MDFKFHCKGCNSSFFSDFFLLECFDCANVGCSDCIELVQIKFDDIESYEIHDKYKRYYKPSKLFHPDYHCKICENIKLKKKESEENDKKLYPKKRLYI